MTRTSSHRTDRPTMHRLIFAVVLLSFLWMPAAAQAASYSVVGRVYSASPLDPGEEAPANPLSGVTADQILGENLVADVPRNLVDVRVLDADDGTELASFITRQDGGYLTSFNAPGGGASVRFVVEELATSKQLLYSEPTTVTDPFSVRFLLVNESATEITDDREFPTLAPAAPAIYTGLFTRVGKIEVATGGAGGTTDYLIDSTTGLANVPPPVASDLRIPPYEDAPFGGNLYLFGAFSQALYSVPNVCYKIRIYEDPSDHSTWTYLDDPLVKTRYSVDLAAGTVDTERVTLGPKPVGGTADCYELTPLSSGTAPGVQVFWSFPDLLGLWRTAGLNGDHELELEIFGLTNPSDFGLVTDTNGVNRGRVTLMLDNVAPVAQILPLDGTDPPNPDTPRVYTPGPAPAGPDLTPTRLGSFPTDYGGTADPTCGILDLQSSTSTQYLAFKLTAHHASSFLRAWHFRYERNDDNNEVVLGKRYDGATNTMVDLPGVRVSSSQTSTGGFQDHFLYLDANHLQPSGTSLGGCAYRFLVRAWTRTTDGYHYLRHQGDQDLHYVQK